MADTTGAGWGAYENVGELLSELDLNADDMAAARQTTEDHVRAWHLAQVRADQDRTQEDVARVLGVKQPRVSAIERGDLDTVTLSTLRAYVRALGGSLHVVADFGDREYRLV